MARAQKNESHFGFGRSLKLASLYAGDRKVLYDFIHNESGKTNGIKHSAASPGKIAKPQTINESPVIPAKKLDEVFGFIELKSYEMEYGEGIEIFRPVEENTEPSTIQNSLIQETGIPETPDGTSVPWKQEFHSDDLPERDDTITPVTVEPENITVSEEEPLVVTAEIPAPIEKETADSSDTLLGSNQLPEEVVSTEEPKAVPSELPEININSSPPEPEEPLKTDEMDFMSWLQSLNRSDDRISEEKDKVKEELSLTGHTAENAESNPVSETLPDMDLDAETEEESVYDPSGWAEIAYDIQAFVKSDQQPEEQPDQKNSSREEIDALLDRFILKNPSMPRVKQEIFIPENMAKKSEEFPTDFVSESLANVFYRQGHLHKSLEIYEKLMLQNPEKKDIFAARIQSIKEELINRL